MRNPVGRTNREAAVFETSRGQMQRTPGRLKGETGTDAVRDDSRRHGSSGSDVGKETVARLAGSGSHRGARRPAFRPPLLIEPYRLADPEKRLAAENALRTTMAGALGGLAVLAGAVVGALTFRETSQQNRRVLELQRRGLVTERFSRAIEHLGQEGDEKLDVRVGGIYELEQIALDSEELHWPIMEVLTAHLRAYRSHDAGTTAAGVIATLRPDAQAIATVIGRRRLDQDGVGRRLALQGVDLTRVVAREAEFGRADLSGVQLLEAYLPYARLEEVDLCGANLNGAILVGAYLDTADLTGANLKTATLREVLMTGADLMGATLDRADLSRARVSDACFLGATLMSANLTGADLSNADLTDARVGHADLTEANLQGAYLQGTRIENAVLHRADLRGAHLERADLTGAHLEDAVLCGACLHAADLSLANMQRANLAGTQLQEADLSGVQLRGAEIAGASFDRVILRHANLDGVDLAGVDLSGVLGLTWAQLRGAANVSLRLLPADVRQEAEGDRAGSL